MGYSFQPWTGKKVMVDGTKVLNYLKETAHEYGIDQHIRYGHQVIRAQWSSENSKWTIGMESRASQARTSVTCGFLLMCTGYYEYAKGYTPEFGRFSGRIVYPQQWPEDFDYKDKRVVIIGSGATAVTLVPTMAKTARRVIMLQRSPSYIVHVWLLFEPSDERACL